MNLDSFRQYAINAGQVATPAGTYLSQCVSLIQQYLNKVYGIPFTPRGDAKDWATNGNVLSYFDRVGSPQAGDIGVSGPTQYNPYGHIWIYTSPSTILEQNGRVTGRVSQGAAYPAIAILRRKGTGEDIVKPSAQQVVDVFIKFLGKAPSSQDEINYYTQRDIRELLTNVLNATVPTVDEVKKAFKNQGLTPSQGQIDYYTQKTAAQMYRDLNAVAQTQGTVAEQKKEIDRLIALSKDGGYTEADREIAKSTNSAVQWIKDKLGGIFK